jgi:hypothetical protein
MHLGTEQFAPFAEIFLAFSSGTFIDGGKDFDSRHQRIGASLTYFHPGKTQWHFQRHHALYWWQIDHRHRAWRRYTQISAPHADVGRHGAWL